MSQEGNKTPDGNQDVRKFIAEHRTVPDVDTRLPSEPTPTASASATPQTPVASPKSPGQKPVTKVKSHSQKSVKGTIPAQNVASASIGINQYRKAFDDGHERGYDLGQSHGYSDGNSVKNNLGKIFTSFIAGAGLVALLTCHSCNGTPCGDSKQKPVTVESELYVDGEQVYGDNVKFTQKDKYGRGNYSIEYLVDRQPGTNEQPGKIYLFNPKGTSPRPCVKKKLELKDETYEVINADNKGGKNE